MKVDVDCTMKDGEAEISISLMERVSQTEFEEFTELMRREGFEYDSYDHSNYFRTKNPRMLKAMLTFLNKEFEVSAVLAGEKKYTWEERDLFVKDFAASLSGQ